MVDARLRCSVQPPSIFSPQAYVVPADDPPRRANGSDTAHRGRQRRSQEGNATKRYVVEKHAQAIAERGHEDSVACWNLDGFIAAPSCLFLKACTFLSEVV